MSKIKKPTKFNYKEQANKFLSAKLEASFITVELWSNKERSYKYVGEIIFERHGLAGFIYDENYEGAPIDPAGLDYRKHGRVFVSGRNNGDLRKFFQNLLPGVFGNRVLQKHDSRWLSLTESQRLAVLSQSHATFDAVRLNAYLGQQDQQIIDIPQLDALIQKIVAFSAEELSDILDDGNKSALTGLKGARGKADYIHKDGRRFVAKPALRHDAWSVVRVEHAMGQMTTAAGIDTVKSKVITLPSGNEVLMSLRYDQGEGKLENGNDRRYTMKKQYNRIAMKAILAQDPDMGNRNIAQATYVDIKNAILKYSDKPIQDVEELYKRVIFHVGSNNTDNNLGNFEMYLDEYDDWRLSPSYDTLPNPERSDDFSVAITDKYNKGSKINFDEDFLDHVAEELGVDPSRGKILAKPVLEVIVNAEHFLKEAGVSDYDINQIDNAFRQSEAQSLIQEISTGMKIMRNPGWDAPSTSGGPKLG